MAAGYCRVCSCLKVLVRWAVIKNNLCFQGIMVKVKEGFGFIRCAEREARMFFHFSEMLCTEHEPRLNDEASFTIIQVCKSCV